MRPSIRTGEAPALLRVNGLCGPSSPNSYRLPAKVPRWLSSLALISDMESEYVIADRAYDSRQFRESIIGNGTTPVIPPRSNRRELPLYDEYLYRERHLVECFIGKLKHYRHIFFPIRQAGK